MDYVLNIADRYVFTPYVYPASWPVDGALRQVLSLLLLTNMGAELLYVGFATFSFYYVFDHRLLKHPHFLEVRSLNRYIFIYIYYKRNKLRLPFSSVREEFIMARAREHLQYTGPRDTRVSGAGIAVRTGRKWRAADSRQSSRQELG